MLIHANPIFIQRDMMLSTPIPLDLPLNALPIEDFDKDGFDLNDFEREAYIANGVPLTNYINRMAYQQEWLNDPFNGKSGLRVDHALLAARLPYVGAARKQVEYLASINPVYGRLLQIKPKWGLDFNLEYIFDNGNMVEIVHIEEDFRNYESFVNRVNEIEKQICYMDFTGVANNMSTMWLTGSAEEINDKKAQALGFKSAYSTLKAI